MPITLSSNEQGSVDIIPADHDDPGAACLLHHSPELRTGGEGAAGGQEWSHRQDKLGPNPGQGDPASVDVVHISSLQPLFRIRIKMLNFLYQIITQSLPTYIYL